MIAARTIDAGAKTWSIDHGIFYDGKNSKHFFNSSFLILHLQLVLWEQVQLGATIHVGDTVVKL